MESVADSNETRKTVVVVNTLRIQPQLVSAEVVGEQVVEEQAVEECVVVRRDCYPAFEMPLQTLSTVQTQSVEDRSLAVAAGSQAADIA